MKFILTFFILFCGVINAADNSYFINHPSDDIRIRYSNDVIRKPLTVKNPKDLSECRAHIAKAVCWVEPAQDGALADELRPCLKDGYKYVSFFENHFDRSSDLIKKMYCSVDKLWVEKKLSSSAYASPLFDTNGQIAAGGVGVRQEILDANLGFDQFLSWKEETSFGGSLKSTDPQMNLIQYSSNKATKDFFVDYVMDHEFGHLFDFANKLNHTGAGSWTDLSWKNMRFPKAENDFPLREQLCYYSCGANFIPHAQATKLFSDLLATNFLSTYASSHPMEDWAESFALYISTVQLGLNLEIHIQGQNFKMTEHFHSPLLKSKRDYVENFLKSGFKYPGE